MRLCLLTLLCLLTAEAAATLPSLKDTLRRYEIREGDTAAYTLNLALDRAGRPKYFFRNIFTPVCNTGECRPVYINLYWDLLGNYLRYDLPGDEVLTKTDHRDFKEEDYRKLQDILAKESSIFSELKMEDLVVKGTENISDSANVRTGATLKTIRNEVIEGAVFTCYTLWHFAHGGTTEQIKNITDSLETPAMLHNFLRSGNHHYQYWAMDKVMDADGKVQPGYEEDIAGVIRGKNIFTARYALQKVHPDYFEPSKRQDWLWTAYHKASYPLQMTILKKLSDITVTDKLCNKIAATITEGNREQLKAKLKILSARPKLPVKTQQLLAEQLSHPGMGEDIYQALKQLKQADASVRQKISAYEKKNE
ncbi:hypothetical protein ACFOTA_03490 [Chitinophaga sp. GCM10012297]|uniref:HEAT repeat domain-containing protein n=1 Tax=Chitinophaga chungangae TaxID=2821488 RepID=A0ABS3Y9U3_9BACT|nr:hypothetical protein [Chitinophaga chungangae]MBO9151255.1 hypothetical protein [Chitinophaga chungangae]